LSERETGTVQSCKQTEAGKMTGRVRADSDGRTVVLYPQKNKETLVLKAGDKVSYRRWYCGSVATALGWQIENEIAVPEKKTVPKAVTVPKDRRRNLPPIAGRAHRRRS
jgi:hypothetical protein